MSRFQRMREAAAEAMGVDVDTPESEASISGTYYAGLGCDESQTYHTDEKR